MNCKNILIVILVIFLPFSSYGQKADDKSSGTITIKGKVSNSSGAPVAGAVFYIDNIRTTNVTKNDGTFKVKISSSILNIEVRSSEYGTCKTPINGRTAIDFILDGDKSIALDPGDNQQTESGKQPSNSKGVKINTYNDIYQMIRGEVSGVVVSGRSLQIKQGHSFFGSGEPLLVINGVIVSSIDNVNPLEVKSIDVLTGSSAAIYGVRGSNGVISISLKNGSEKEK